MIPGIRFTAAPPAGRPCVVPVGEGQAVPPDLADAARAAGFRGQAGTAAEALAGGPALLLGLGPGDAASLRRAGALASARFSRHRRVALDARTLERDAALTLAAAMTHRAWRTGRWRSVPADDASRIERIDVAVADPDAAARAFTPLRAVLDGADQARIFTAAPANVLTPVAFARALSRLEDKGIEVTVLGRAELRRAGMGGLLAVGRASASPPRLVVLRWRGTIDARPLLLVGKGLCFDTGGVCIKPAHRMEEMRGDMAGAAACAGAMMALAARRSPAPVVAVLPLAENATGAASYRPSDVLRMADGSTVEVVDTDAEGRLVLGDAMAWGLRRHRPQAVVTIATLTGAIVTALGRHQAGLFASDDGLAATVAAAGAQVGEPVWRMPIGARHEEDLRSDIADRRHCTTGRLQPDACHAAAFLRHFTAGVPWAHLDIAGVDAHAEADDDHAAGPTGFGVALLDRLAALRFEDPDGR